MLSSSWSVHDTLRNRRLLLFATLIVSTGLLLAVSGPAQSHEVPAVAGPGGFQCSPAPCVLPPTQASEGGSQVTDTPIVGNPTNKKELLLGSVDFNCNDGATAVGFHLSRNGGSNWERVLCMPFIYTARFVYVPLDEPLVGYDLKGTAYAAGLYFDNDAFGTGFVAVQTSSNGAHWNQPVVALGRAGKPAPGWAGLTVDESADSPFVNSVYISAQAGNGHRTYVKVSHSTDGGKSWKQVEVDAVQVFPEEDRETGVAVGKDGAVYVTWLHCRGKNEEGGGLCPTVHVMFSKSTDGGDTWSSAQEIATVGMPKYWWLPNTDDVGVDNYPMVAVDNSGGPNAGNIYVVMYNWTGSYLHVQMIRSTDGGNTWSQPVYLAPKSDTHDQFFPSISVGPKGKVGVSWLDRRNDPKDIDYQAFAAISTDGGRTFGQNWQLTTAFSNPNTNGGNNWMGDYTGNTWKDDDTFIAAWMDSSNGVDMQEMVGGVRLK